MVGVGAQRSGSLSGVGVVWKAFPGLAAEQSQLLLVSLGIWELRDVNNVMLLYRKGKRIIQEVHY